MHNKRIQQQKLDRYTHSLLIDTDTLHMMVLSKNIYIFTFLMGFNSIPFILLQFSIETDHRHDPRRLTRMFSSCCWDVTCIFHFTLWCHHHINNTFLRVNRAILVAAVVVVRTHWMDDRCHCRPSRTHWGFAWGIVFTRKIWIDRCAFMRMSGWMNQWMSKWHTNVFFLLGQQWENTRLQILTWCD